jgi:Uma2 family endonuclease
MDPKNLVYDVRKEPMLTDITKRLFTVDEYYRMADAGILTESDRVELIDGEIIEMSPIGARHANCVLRAGTLFTRTLGEKALVSVQNPLRLTRYTEPQPDIVVLKPRADFYGRTRYRPGDALLVVEVAETTLRYDRNVKLPRYAAAGIAEVWIEDLRNNLLLVYRKPAGNRFKTELTFHRDDFVSPLAFPEAIFRVEDLLG